MIILNFPLANVLPNPYQTRESENPEHIQNLAESIKAHGLMQIPVGTCSDDNPQTNEVILAFGHSRLAAYRLLNEQGVPGFDNFPVNVLSLNDAQLFEMAVAENLERKDLTPIEEAKAMQRYMVEFKKNSKEVGDLFHLSDSAVRNKLRLLGLPAEAQAKLKAGEITEGTARELLGWYELPQEWRDDSARYGRKTVEQKAFSGAGTDTVREEIQGILKYYADELSQAPWKWDEKLTGEGILGLCKGCAQNIEKDKKSWCTNKVCFKAKKKAWIKSYLSQASLLSGIQAIEEEKQDTPTYSLNTFSSYNSTEQETLRKSIDGGCENLRLVFEEHPNASNERDRDYLAGIGFAHARIICGKRIGFCACKNAASKGVNIKTEDGTIDQERLKEIRRLEKEQSKLDRRRIEEMRTAAVREVMSAVLDNNLDVWKEITLHLFYRSEEKDPIKNAVSVEEIWKALVSNQIGSMSWTTDPKIALREFNAKLKELGLSPLDWEIEPEEPKGKTLMEVFKGEE